MSEYPAAGEQSIDGFGAHAGLLRQGLRNCGQNSGDTKGGEGGNDPKDGAPVEIGQQQAARKGATMGAMPLTTIIIE